VAATLLFLSHGEVPQKRARESARCIWPPLLAEQEDYSGAVQACSDALELRPEYVKALMRRCPGL